MVYCYVCGKEINFLGWANHVRMEKKKHGKDIYKRLKAEREGRIDIKLKNLKNKKIDNYGGMK